MKTFIANLKTVSRHWLLIDANNIPLGRLATAIAIRLRGKHKPEFTPNMDVGDYVIVINAKKIYTSGNKMDQKKYYHYTGYPGGIKEISLKKMLATHPERVIQYAVKRMLPKGPLARKMLKKLKVYEGIEHQHVAQQPKVLILDNKMQEE